MPSSSVGVVQLLLDPHIGVAAELDVGAAAGHVGGDRHRAAGAGLRHDRRLLLMVAGVQHPVRHLLLLQQRREMFGLLDRHGADQNRLPALPAFLDHRDDRVVLLAGGAIDLVVVVGADARHVGRDVDDLQLVDLLELAGLGHRRAGHAGQLGIQAEVVLEGDRGERLVLLLNLHALLRFQRLVQALRVAAALHHPAGELVDDDDLVVLDDVVGVAAEQLVRAQRLIGVMHERDVGDVVEAALRQQPLLAQQLLHLLGAALGEGDRARLLVLLEVVVGEARNQLVDADVELGGILGRAGDDQRRPRLVDQDRVDLVDDGVVERPMHHLVQPELHVVAEVVEAELVVGAVRDVGGIGIPPLGIGQAVDDAADGEAEEAIDRAHPLGVAPRQVVVDGDDVHALAPAAR